MRLRGRRVLRRKTRRALVLRRQDWIVIATLILALIGSIIIWVLFLTAWNPKTTLVPSSRTSWSPDRTSVSGPPPTAQALPGSTWRVKRAQRLTT